jgi:hypothetical protein
LALLWAARQAWILGRPWAARLWTLVLALSGLVLLWAAYVHHFLNFYLKY